MKSSRHRLHVTASRVHKWLALVIGFQLILWFSSGALMSFLSIDKVHGDHLVDRKTIAAIPAAGTFADVGAIARTIGTPVEGITVRMLLGRPVFEATAGKNIHLFDARTGAPLPPLIGRDALKIASDAWRGAGHPAATVARISQESTEYRGVLPAWRVEFADPDTTRVFVAADTGRITAVRTGTWRLYDFFWGLHIMDWKNHENFNTPWLLGFAVGGLALGIAGTILLFMRWPVRHRRKANRET